jgi:hypothetical protein
VLTRLTPGSAYNLRVSTTDQAGNGPTQSDIINFTASNTSDTTPPAISEISTNGTTHNKLVASWTTDEPATSILLAIESGTTDTVTVSESSFKTTHFLAITDTNIVKPNTTYNLIIESTDASGNTGINSSTMVTTAAFADVTPPSAPASLTATPGNEQVQLSWGSVSDADLAGYDVFQDNTKIVSGLTERMYDATGLTNGIQVTFTVIAVDQSGNESVPSPQASATPSVNQAPGAPPIRSPIVPRRPIPLPYTVISH